MGLLVGRELRLPLDEDGLLLALAVAADLDERLTVLLDPNDAPRRCVGDTSRLDGGVVAPLLAEVGDQGTEGVTILFELPLGPGPVGLLLNEEAPGLTTGSQYGLGYRHEELPVLRVSQQLGKGDQLGSSVKAVNR
jgi:hypothetical protein